MRCAREKCTILLSTYRLEDAERLCGRVMIIKEGRKIALGSPEELCEKVAGPPILQINLREVNKNILETLLVTSISDGELLLGKILVSFIPFCNSSNIIIHSLLYRSGYPNL